ncbi:hypothetical protein EJ03DRAFT_140240 [Teratosphaeria nubilosa]|uniref:Uncharacterized protein n=1 Tax=Teratosphaeria nubilosa TaxID=161662 RepID=A0A6G1L5T6_9PEZI|nr:hypothetical protein EJ03DRAFT_140240 [Teratosphaeria nubilosa]
MVSIRASDHHSHRYRLHTKLGMHKHAIFIDISGIRNKPVHQPIPVDALVTLRCGGNGGSVYTRSHVGRGFDEWAIAMVFWIDIGGIALSFICSDN